MNGWNVGALSAGERTVLLVLCTLAGFVAGVACCVAIARETR